MKLFNILISLCLLLLGGCGQGPENVAGTGSRTGNAIVSGVIENQDGSVAADVEVAFIPVSTDPTPSAGNLVKITARTDADGVYRVNTALTGNWNLFADNGAGKLAYKDSLVFDGDTTVVPTAQLTPQGGLKIVFKVQPQHDPRFIDIIFWGTDFNQIPMDSNGLMRMDSLAEGMYPVRIKLPPDYAILDTVFNVRAGIIDGPDTIALRYLGVPVVTGLKADYDTLNGAVVLTWNRLDTSVIIGYNIYQSIADTQFIQDPVNRTSVKDTFYRPPDIIVGTTYVYRVKGINKNGDVCPLFSNADTVFAANPNLVKTEISVRALNTIHDSVSIKDTVRFTATYINLTRKNKLIEWFVDSSASPVLTETLDVAACCQETLAYAWSVPGRHLVSVNITDEAGTKWWGGNGLCIVAQDPPLAFAGNDTSVRIGETIRLHGQGSDRFGYVAEWAWDVGCTGNFTASSNGAMLPLAPDTENIGFLCALRIKDDDGNYGFDTVSIAVFDQYTPVVDTNYRVTDIQQTSVVIRWNTNIASLGQVFYGSTPSCDMGTQTDPLSLSHVVQVSGLSPATLYFYRAFSQSGVFSDTSPLAAFSTRLTATPRYVIKRLPAGSVPVVDGVLTEWPPEYLITTISGDENVYGRDALTAIDPSVEWNGALYAAWDDDRVYFAVKVTADDVYLKGHGTTSGCGSGNTTPVFDNLKIHPGGCDMGFYMWSNGDLEREPSFPYDIGSTIIAAVTPVSGNGLPEYEFSLARNVLDPFDMKDFQISVYSEDQDEANGTGTTVLGFGTYYVDSKQDWASTPWGNPLYYPAYNLADTEGPGLK